MLLRFAKPGHQLPATDNESLTADGRAHSVQQIDGGRFSQVEEPPGYLPYLGKCPSCARGVWTNGCG